MGVLPQYNNNKLRICGIGFWQLEESINRGQKDVYSYYMVMKHLVKLPSEIN